MTTTPMSFDPEKWVVNRLYERIHKWNQNALVGFFGPPRKGKTYSALSLAEQVSAKLGLKLSLEDVTFSVANRYGYDGLMHRVNRIPPRGTAIGLDDAATAAGANSRKWFSSANEALSTIGQSAGFLGYLLWVSCPESDEIDSQFRALFHITFDVKRIDRQRNLVITKPGIPYRDGKTNRIRTKYPRANLPGFGHVRVKRVAFRLPSQASGPFHTWPAYEARKAAFMRPLYIELEEGLDRRGEKRNPEWAQKALLLVRKSHPKWTQAQIGEALGIHQATVAKLLAASKPQGTPSAPSAQSRKSLTHR